MNEREQLKERKKELDCIYRIDKLIEEETDVYSFLMASCGVIADGFQFPLYISVMIEYDDIMIKSPYFRMGRNYLLSEIKNTSECFGKITVYYSDKLETGNPFLQEEQHLLNSISKRISDYLYLKKSITAAQKQKSINCYAETRINILNNAVDTIDFENLGIYNIYLIGSVKNFKCGVSSDIDLIVHYNGSEFSKEKIKLWFNAWSQSVIQLGIYSQNIQIAGDLFDLHFITERDIEEKSSYAVMINSVNNSARLIKSNL